MKKSMQKQLIMITLTLIFAVIICGAVSAADIYVNDSGNDNSGTGTIDNPYKTINWGINNANSDDTINLNAGTFNTYTDSTHKDYNITINKNLNIKGAGQDQTIIDAGGKGWVFTILPGFTVNISNLTITNGKASDGTAGNDGDNGGGIRNRGTLTLNNVTITNCRAGNGGNGNNGGSGLLDRNGKNGGNGGNGGAIYNTGTLTLNNCVLSGNRAGNGGNGGNAYNNGILLSGGDGGDGGLGGAIYNEEILLDGVECTVSITRSTINGNYAGNGGNGGNGYNRGSGGDGGDGGAIYIGGNILNGSDLTLTRSTIKDNVAGTRGLRGTGSSGGSNGSNGSVGGIYVNVYADATIQYNYLLNNSQYDIRKHGTDSVNARYNWWGSNGSPASRVAGNVNYSPWTTLSINANPGTIYNGQQSTVTAQFSYDVPDGIPVNFSFQGAPLGTLDTNPAYTNNGAATTTFTANTVGTSHVLATVDSQTVGPADIQINPAADLSISKSVDNVSHPGQTINYQDNIRYTITVNNTGLDPAENVVIKDTISSLLNFNPASVTSNVAFTYDWDSVNRIFTVYLTNPLNAGATAYLYLPAQVLAHNQNVDNTANVTTTTYDPTTPDETSLSFFVPAAAYIDISKEFRDLVWTVINSANYQDYVWTIIKAHNNGPDDATNVQISDSLPTGLIPDYSWIWLSTDGGNSWNPTSSYSGNTWTIANLPNGADYWLAIWTQVTAHNTTITNTATQIAQDQYPYNGYDSATAQLTVPAASYVDIYKEFRDAPWGNVITTAYYKDKIYAMVQVLNEGPDSTSLSVLDLLTGITWTGNYYVLSGSVFPLDPDNWVFNDPVNSFNGTHWNIPFFSSAIGGNVKWLAIEGIVDQVGTVSNYAETDDQSAYPYDGYDSATADLTANAAPTSITVNSVSGYKGDTVTLTTTLKDNNGNPLEGKTVTFTVGSWSQDAITNANGEASVIYTITQDVGTYAGLITVAFAGDNQYVACNANNDLTVNAIPTKLTVENVIGNKDHSVDLKAKLWDTFHDKAVAGKLVDFYVKGVKVGSAYTDANGVATLSYNIDLVGGTYDIGAEFAADGQYAGSTGNGTLKVPQSGVYVITTTSKNNPTVGETIKITFKLGNKGPDTAEDVKFTYVLPEGLELMNISGDGDYSYDPVTRTITWNLGDVPVGDPWLYVMVKVLKSGSFTIDPSVSTITYDPNLSSSIQFATVNAVTQVKAASKTIPLQKTGLPLAGLVLAVLAIFGGLIMPKGKN